MKISKEVDEVLDKIEKRSKPVSIFLYGSRARNDFKEDSDYEIGILFEKDKKWGRRELSQLHNLTDLNLYPFVYEDFLKYSLDTPFPRVIYMRELLEGAKTVKGKKVVENMKPPAIYSIDLLENGTFQVAYALAAVLSSRQKDWVTASNEFTKSVLFGARILVITVTGKFPLEYGEIAKQALKLEIESEFKDLIKHAIQVRQGAKVDPKQLYTNITFLNRIVLQRLRRKMKKENKIVLKGKRI